MVFVSRMPCDLEHSRELILVSLDDVGQLLVLVNFRPLFLQFLELTQHPIDGPIMVKDRTRLFLKTLMSLLDNSVHPIVDDLCSTNECLHGKLGSPRHPV